MATRPAVRPRPAAPVIPLTTEAFAESCLDAVLARHRSEAHRRENGRAQKAAYVAAGHPRGARNAPRMP